MATPNQVKQYLAYWLQLGKKVRIQTTGEAIAVQTVIQGDRYSDDFEACWQKISSPETGDCYLEGTNQTIQDLLTPAWEINPCVRCDMPVPVFSLGMPSLSCPCIDLPLWPNTEIPQPRSPIKDISQLVEIRDRLLRVRNIPHLTPEQLKAKRSHLKTRE